MDGSGARELQAPNDHLGRVDHRVQRLGPGGGVSQVHTIISNGFARRCPDLTRFFSQLHFNVDIENEWMHSILDLHKDPNQVARDWVNAPGRKRVACPRVHRHPTHR